jgi:hypothetical protein
MNPRWTFACVTAPAVAVLLVEACGGLRSSGTSPDNDASFDAGPVVTGPDGCVSESGYLVCRGRAECPIMSAQCLDCLGEPDATGLCVTEAMGTTGAGACPLCDDGNVCVRVFDNAPYQCLPFDVGQLFAANGSADRVRYEDWSSWTGQALPRPTDCGDAGLPLCGGLCQPCSPGAVCTGRSPRHPFGLCVPTSWTPCTRSAPTCTTAGNMCIIFDDDQDAQALADRNGLCIPTAECKALGQGYPGGATCAGGG